MRHSHSLPKPGKPRREGEESQTGRCSGSWEYVQSVNDTRDVSKNRQQDIDEEIGTTASLFVC